MNIYLDDRYAGHLAAVIEWAKGNRGNRSGSPYSVPEISAALELFADGITAESGRGCDKYDVDTAAIAEEFGL